MTDHATRLADVEVTEIRHDPATGWSVTVAVVATRSTFTLVRPAARLRPETCSRLDGDNPAREPSPDPAPDEEDERTRRPCPGCGAEPDEPCRWGCLSHVTEPDHTDR